MERTCLNLLLHMHQPLYRDPDTGIYTLPFVRLNALRGYYDIMRTLSRFDQARVAVNFSPSLLVQIHDYMENPIDTFREIALREADSLSGREMEFMERFFFLCPGKTMIEPHPRYRELHERYGEGRGGGIIPSTGEIRDLQVWSSLTWFGFSARADFPEIRELMEKGRDFSEDDKRVLFEAEKRVISSILPGYRRLFHEGRVEISVSPFYHPILPLIFDSDSARRCLDTPLPLRFNFPEDAAAQVREALEYGERVFGKRPDGIWPSEGSLSPEVIGIFEEHGVSWTATDRGILERSTPSGRKMGPRGHIYPYRVEGGRSAIFFRDTELSNLISFDFPSVPATSSVQRFLKGVLSLAGEGAAPEVRPLVSVMVDGENPWPYYPGGGVSCPPRLSL